MNPDMNHTRNLWLRFAAGAAACSIFSLAALAQDVTEPPLAEPPLSVIPAQSGSGRKSPRPRAGFWTLPKL